jgi:glycerol-3-phosphate dehydrogenase
VKIKDLENNEELEIHSKTVINATGVFVDNIIKMNGKAKQALVKASQGIHIVLDRSFMEGENALMIPSTSDGRVLFVVPWHNHLLAGTTDTPVETHSLEPVALEQEVEFVLETLQGYLTKKPEKKDILSIFAGLRPLVQPDKAQGTKEISRDHKLSISESNLITITGGKWTTYRQMAEEVVDAAIKIGNLKSTPCKTQSLRIHGYTTEDSQDHLNIYGSDARNIHNLSEERPELKKLLHPKFPHILAEVVWAARYEMARTVEDVLGRRLRMLFLNAGAAIEAAPTVARILREELNKESAWENEQIQKFTEMAQNYLPGTKHSLKEHATT